MKPLRERLTPESLAALDTLPKQELTAGQQEWIAGLRSGEFIQAAEFLCVKGITYCCLGVRCEQLARQGFLTRHDDRNPIVHSVGYSDINDNTNDPHKTFLPRLVSEMDHFRNDCGDFKFPIWVDDAEDKDYHQANSLTTLNDEHDATFEDIAWLVETYPALVFLPPK